MAALGLAVAACCVALLAGGGTGASAAPPRAAQVPPPSPNHVDTWALDDGCNGGFRAGAALVRRWLTFAESNCGPNARKASTDCHAGAVRYCAAMQYLDTDWIYGDARVPIGTASHSTWWLHEPAGRFHTRVFGNQEGGGYLLNQSVSAVRTWFRNYVRRHYNHDDGLLMDDQAPSLSEELYYSTCGCRSTFEIRKDSVLRAAHNAMSATLTHADGVQFLQADNTLAPNPFLPQGLNMLDRVAGVDGLIAEGDPLQFGVLDPYYSTLLDQIAYILNRTPGFVVVMSHGNAGAGSLPRARRIQEATVMLGYSRGRMVDWADLEIGSRSLAVFPEEGIVPTAALQSMGAPGGHGCLAGTGLVCPRGGHNSLQVAAGVYRREFRSCANQGKPFGACAAIINTTGSAVTVRAGWLRQHYGHVITTRGGDVESRGAINLAGATFGAGRTRIPAHDAILLAP